MTGEGAQPRHDPAGVGGRHDHGRASGAHNLIVRVCPGDIDRMGHVNNSVYLRWIEEAVHAHWAALATPTEFAAYLWLAVRHELDYRRPAFAEDILRVETRIVAIRRVRAWYETAVTCGEAVLVEARSCWCCIDAESRGLTPIPAEMTKRFLPENCPGS
ncbi:acyl-CoA thioesterase [Sphingomonas oryzagri]